MNLVQYYDDCISEYKKTLELLYNAQGENDIEIAINNIIDYIFKYNNTQYFEGFDTVGSLLGDIVDFCSSTDYSYEQLLIYKDNLTTELELFKNSVIENNTIQVVFSSSNLMNKYKNYIKDMYLNDFGKVKLFLYDNQDSTDLSKYNIACNIDEYLSKAVKSTIPKSRFREALHLMSNLNKIEDSTCDIKKLITGSSYSLYGIDNNFLDKKTLNASMLAQDLYISYQIIKRAIESNKLNECILTIAYYNFHLDISSIKTEFYKELFGRVYYANLLDKHNSKDDLEKFKLKGNIYEIPAEIRDIFNDKLSDYILHEAVKDASNYEEYFTNDYTREMRVGEIKCGKNIDLSIKQKEEHMTLVSNNHNKLFQYKETEMENKDLLRDLLLLLNEHKVKITLLVPPMPKLYRENINPHYKILFDSYINELNLEYDFELLDFYSDERFSYTDFADGHHLNSIGAKKLTELLKETTSI